MRALTACRYGGGGVLNGLFYVDGDVTLQQRVLSTLRIRKIPDWGTNFLDRADKLCLFLKDEELSSSFSISLFFFSFCRQQICDGCPIFWGRMKFVQQWFDVSPLNIVEDIWILRMNTTDHLTTSTSNIPHFKISFFNYKVLSKCIKEIQ